MSGHSEHCTRDGHDTHARGDSALDRPTHGRYHGGAATYGYPPSRHSADIDTAGSAIWARDTTHPRKTAQATADRNWVDLLERAVGGARGSAIAQLAELLRVRGHSRDWKQATELSVTLLEGYDDRACETIAFLVADGWHGRLGELFAAVRAIH